MLPFSLHAQTQIIQIRVRVSEYIGLDLEVSKCDSYQCLISKTSTNSKNGMTFNLQNQQNKNIPLSSSISLDQGLTLILVPGLN